MSTEERLLPYRMRMPSSLAGHHSLDLLGGGSQGMVMYAIDEKTGEERAIKKIPKKDIDNLRTLREIEAGLTLADVKGVAALKSYFESATDYYLIFELVSGKDLFTTMEKNNFTSMPEILAKKIFTQVIESLSACHKRGIAHKDIKLENIMYDPVSDKATLIDFGLCSFYLKNKEAASADRSGSREYCAPEILLKEAFDPTKADVWSLGVTLFGLLYGKFPFGAKEARVFQQTRKHPSVHIPKDKKKHPVSDEAIDLIKKMLEPNPKDRITLEEIKSHPWVTGRNIAASPAGLAWLYKIFSLAN